MGKLFLGFGFTFLNVPNEIVAVFSYVDSATVLFVSVDAATT